MNTLLRYAYLATFLFILAPSALLAQVTKERDYEIALTKGQYEIELENYPAAIGFLEQALKLKPGDQEAQVSLGIALSRGGELARARDVLKQAAERDPKDGRARYELALVMGRLGDKEDARAVMEQALALSRDDTLSAAARGFLREAGPAGKPALNLAAGLQYDSNVILEQDDPVTPSSEDKADWRGVVIVNGTLPFLTTETRGGEAGYQFYQSLHLNLEDYNVQQHAARLGGHTKLSKASRLDLSYAFVYSFVGSEHYSTTHRISPRLTSSLTPDSLTELHGAYESTRFFNTPVFTTLTDKNGTNTAIGVTHTIKAGARSALSFDYTYDTESAEKEHWDYAGHKIAANALTEQGGYSLFLGVSYYDRRYGGTPPGASEKRHDGVQELSLGISRKAGRVVTLSLSDTFTFNDSNLTQYEYKRNILGFFVEMSL